MEKGLISSSAINHLGMSTFLNSQKWERGRKICKELSLLFGLIVYLFSKEQTLARYSLWHKIVKKTLKNPIVNHSTMCTMLSKP